jgi:hypothetical protein
LPVAGARRRATSALRPAVVARPPAVPVGGLGMRPVSGPKAAGCICIEPSTAAARRSIFCYRRSAALRRRSGSSGRHWPSLIRLNPRTITVDKNGAHPMAATETKKNGEHWRRSRLRHVKYLNNIVEQDHPGVKRNSPGTWLWWLLEDRTNAGRLRGDGDDQERAGSEHQRQGHQCPGRVHRRTVPGGSPRRHRILSQIARRPTLNYATEPAASRRGHQ